MVLLKLWLLKLSIAAWINNPFKLDILQDLIYKLILEMFSGPTNFVQAYAHHMQHSDQR